MLEKNKNVDEESQFETEIKVPDKIKPYIHKEVNFKLYTELLMEKNDQMRVSISLSEFRDIDFSCLGLPKLYIKICQFMTASS